MNLWLKLIEQIQLSWATVESTAALFWQGIAGQFSLLGLIDIVLVFAVLWWLYKKLRRSDLIKIFPKILFLLLMALIARTLGLWALFIVASSLIMIALLAVAALYAPEIKAVLESTGPRLNPAGTQPRASVGDIQQMIKAVAEATAVLSRAHKPSLIVIKKDKSLIRLIENGTKMNSVVTSELLIDFFGNGSVLGRGAVIIDTNRIVSAGSTLLSPRAKVLFSATNPIIKKVAKDWGTVVVVVNKTIGDIMLLHGDDTYKNLTPSELSRILKTILVYPSA
ncbi:hypothetical protein A3K24_00645 [candidate division Kazan bacterium RIFCSPHIGHO2_01_FULL_44_14]|uniref:DAC domain-containing protein n=1 Tax=candidate division Kazan bacterium RIFCSPLOWO2_01_FULL_45_19 TaxID=1798538 RepID=A0A1F4NPJ1_UNCK3|nr:MAG: hypothetical protein A3K51_00645 [candidate division Kazan bacterium RIFCSPLOWO2_01_FULL_45_19]OGB77618.1 MAG: hypothetical protein A3K24_00645 [candidate division Kazan bacterium RIFCSPHIGHO2_01_FULL_44_14]